MPNVETREQVPTGACDCHLHVFDGKVAGRIPVPDDAGAEEYGELRSRLGFSRAVLVQPRSYWTDNSVLLRAIETLGRTNTRGVAVIHPDVGDRELHSLHEGGVRGVRFSLFTAKDAVVGFDMVKPVVERVRALGWHAQIHWTADQIVEHKNLLLGLEAPLVFDHMARLPPDRGTAHPAFDLVRGLVQDGRAWVKLSGPYLDSAVGEREAYADMDAIARAWVAATPDRLVWGSDWPHMSERPNAPSTFDLFRLFARWESNADVRNAILVQNPARLYGFEAPAPMATPA